MKRSYLAMFVVLFALLIPLQAADDADSGPIVNVKLQTAREDGTDWMRLDWTDDGGTEHDYTFRIRVTKGDSGSDKATKWKAEIEQWTEDLRVEAVGRMLAVVGQNGAWIDKKPSVNDNSSQPGCKVQFIPPDPKISGPTTSGASQHTTTRPAANELTRFRFYASETQGFPSCDAADFVLTGEALDGDGVRHDGTSTVYVGLILSDGEEVTWESPVQPGMTVAELCALIEGALSVALPWAEVDSTGCSVSVSYPAAIVEGYTYGSDDSSGAKTAVEVQQITGG